MGFIPLIGSIPIIPFFVKWIVLAVAIVIIIIIFKFGYGNPSSSSKIKAFFARFAVGLLGASWGYIGCAVLDSLS